MRSYGSDYRCIFTDYFNYLFFSCAGTGINFYSILIANYYATMEYEIENGMREYMTLIIEKCNDK